MNFKVGDRVVVVTDRYDTHTSYKQLGLRGCVYRLRHVGMPIRVAYDNSKLGISGRNSYYEEDLVLEGVYDSPLYQALL